MERKTASLPVRWELGRTEIVPGTTRLASLHASFAPGHASSLRGFLSNRRNPKKKRKSLLESAGLNMGMSRIKCSLMAPELAAKWIGTVSVFATQIIGGRIEYHG